MKKKLLIFSVILLAIACNTTKPTAIYKSTLNENYKSLQSFSGDTAAYYQYNFIDNKDKYVGKNVTMLFDDLEVPIKSNFWGGGSYGKFNSIHFSSEIREKTSYRMGSTGKGSLYLLTVELTEEFPLEPFMKEQKEHNNGEVTKDQYPYYSQFIIKGIYFKSYK